MSQAQPEQAYFFDDYYPKDDLAEVRDGRVDQAAIDYMKQIESIPVMDPIEVRQLATFIQEGRNAAEVLEMLDFIEVPREGEVTQIEARADAVQIARERLCTGHLRLAAHIARLTMGWAPGGKLLKDTRESMFKGAIFRDLRVFAGAPLTLADRIQAANEGLWRATKSYKPDGGANFTTYAMYWIEHLLVRTILQDRHLKVPLHIQEDLSKIKLKKIEADSVEFPSMAEAIGFDSSRRPETVLRYLQELMETQWLEELELASVAAAEPASTDDEPAPTFLETVPYADISGYTLMDEETAEQNIARDIVTKSLKTLPQIERRILQLRFGFDDQPWTLEAIGHELDLTRERVRQLEGQAMSRLGMLGQLLNLISVKYNEKEVAKSEVRTHIARVDEIIANNGQRIAWLDTQLEVTEQDDDEYAKREAISQNRWQWHQQTVERDANMCLRSLLSQELVYIHSHGRDVPVQVKSLLNPNWLINEVDESLNVYQITFSNSIPRFNQQRETLAILKNKLSWEIGASSNLKIEMTSEHSLTRWMRERIRAAMEEMLETGSWKTSGFGYEPETTDLNFTDKEDKLTI